MDPKISIIIPVYNTEEFLGRCLDSVCSQTMADIEILVINDGSPDNSQQIIDEYKSRDKRIKAIAKQNEGLSYARNTALDVAEGEYVAFVDSDDWIEPDMCEVLYKYAESSHAEIINFNFKKVSPTVTGDPERTLPPGLQNVNDSSRYQFTYDFIFSCGDGASVWNKLYSRHFIERHKLRFIRNSDIFAEDLLFNLFCLVHVNRVFTTGKVFYNYYLRPGSIVHAYNPNITGRYLRLVEVYIEYLKRNKSEKLLEDIVPFILFNAVSCGMHNAYKYGAKLFSNMKEEAIKAIQYPVYSQNYYRNMDFGKLKVVPSPLHRIYLRLFNTLMLAKCFTMICIIQYVRFKYTTEGE